MKLKTYLKNKKITQEELAKELTTTQVQISRWSNGIRIPRPAEMVKIYRWSNGQVQPNDFYDIDSTKTDKSQQKTNFEEKNGNK